MASEADLTEQLLKNERRKRVFALRANVPDGGFQSGDEWRAYMEAICEAGGRYTAPKRGAFGSSDAFARATELHKLRISTGSFTGRQSTAIRANVPDGGFVSGDDWMAEMNAVVLAGGRYAPPKAPIFATEAAFKEAKILHVNRVKFGGLGREGVKHNVPTLRVPTKGFESGEQWMQSIRAVCEGGGKYAPPVEFNFGSTEAFEEAKALHEHRERNGGAGRKSKADYAETANGKRRTQYANDKETDEGRKRLKEKQKIDDANKLVRKAKAIAAGMAWCAHGSHAVPKEDMEFDPAVDLNLTDCIAGRRRHHACIRHFAAYHVLHLRHNRSREAFVAKEKYEARLRGLQWELSDEKVDELIEASSCYLCHRAVERIPSIDRVDPWSYYKDDNVKPSCIECNIAKGGLTEDEFRGCCRRMANFMTNGVPSDVSQPFRRIVRRPIEDDGDKVPRAVHADYTFEGRKWRAVERLLCKASNYAISKRGAEERKLAFEITPEMHADITSRPCSYCGLRREGGIGMDRADSNVGYTLSNVVPCCPTCNFMKRLLTVDQFRILVMSVAAAS